MKYKHLFNKYCLQIKYRYEKSKFKIDTEILIVSYIENKMA